MMHTIRARGVNAMSTDFTPIFTPTAKLIEFYVTVFAIYSEVYAESAYFACVRTTNMDTPRKY